MFQNIGEKLKSAAKLVVTIGLVVVAIYAIFAFVELGQYRGDDVGMAILMLLLMIALYIGLVLVNALMVYGLGELVCNAQDSRYYLQKMSGETDIAPERRVQPPVYTPYTSAPYAQNVQNAQNAQPYQAPPAPAPAPVPNGMKQCKYCGSVSSFERFCPNCGSDNT